MITKPLEELDGKLITDSQDLEPFCSMVPTSLDWLTGVVVTDNGDVWMTEGCAPCEIETEYVFVGKLEGYTTHTHTAKSNEQQQQGPGKVPL